MITNRDIAMLHQLTDFTWTGEAFNAAAVNQHMQALSEP